MSGNTIEPTLQDTSVVISEFQTASAANAAPDLQFLWNGIYHMESVWLGYLEPLNGLLNDDVLASTNATPLERLPGPAVPDRLVQRAAAVGLQQGAVRQGGPGRRPAAGDVGRAPGGLRGAQGRRHHAHRRRASRTAPGASGSWATRPARTSTRPPRPINLFTGDARLAGAAATTRRGHRLAELWNAGYFNDDMNSIDLYPGIDLFSTGPGRHDPDRRAARAQRQQAQLGAENVGVMTFPVFGTGAMAGKPIFDNQGSASPRQSANKEVAADFLRFLHTPERVAAIWDQVAAVPNRHRLGRHGRWTDPRCEPSGSAGSSATPCPTSPTSCRTLFWTDAMFVNSQKIVSGEYTGEQAGENANRGRPALARSRTPTCSRTTSIWAQDLGL